MDCPLSTPTSARLKFIARNRKRGLYGNDLSKLNKIKFRTRVYGPEHTSGQTVRRSS